MTGHGSPRTSPTRCAPRPALRGWGCALLVLAALWGIAGSGSFTSSGALRAAETTSLRLRLAWGGGAARAWTGSLVVRGGTLSDLAPLGIQPDALRGLYVDGDRLTIRPESPRNYDGCDVTVSAPLDARLEMELTDPAQPDRVRRFAVSVLQVVSEPYRQPLDEVENRLLIRRAPGDLLRVEIEREHLVFDPGETFRFRVGPAVLPIQAGSSIELHLRMSDAAEGRVWWSDAREATLRPDEASADPLGFQLAVPAVEGVYQIEVEASTRRLPTRLGLKQVLARRRIDLVVVAPTEPPTAEEAAARRVLEIDPVKPGWWNRLAANIPLLPNWRRGPLGSGEATAWQHPLGELVQLSPRADANDRSWQAYPLPLRHPGRPHVLEIDYPSDVPQSLGVSLIEPNAAGAVVPIGLDSGVLVPDEAAGTTPQWETHRVVFWPHTRTPLLLVTNHRPHASAVYGRIRVLEMSSLPRLALPPLPEPPVAAGARGAVRPTVAAAAGEPFAPLAESSGLANLVDPSELADPSAPADPSALVDPSAPAERAELPERAAADAVAELAEPAPFVEPDVLAELAELAERDTIIDPAVAPASWTAPQAASPPTAARLFAAYFDRPLFPENFSAPETLDPASGRSLDDWQTFYLGASRLVEYLQHTGYNTLVLTVAADGGAIYPSRWLGATPRYDTGGFFDLAPDPVQKDVVELLARLCNRAGLRLVPVVHFSTPLPALEEQLRGSDPRTSGLSWVGDTGQRLEDVRPPRQGLVPYYNALNPAVQSAMQAVVDELIQRYGDHPSFGGVGVSLSGHGYGQLPGAEWGFDDATVAQFERDTGIEVPDEGAAPWSTRAQFLQKTAREAWIEWRCDVLGGFYRRLGQRVAARRGDARLYLASAGLFSGPQMQRRLRPALPQREGLDAVLRGMGLDPRDFTDAPSTVFLRPQLLVPQAALCARSVELELNLTPDLDRPFRELPVRGSMFFHEPLQVRLPSFDAVSPFRSSYTLLTAQLAPAGQRNRQRFAHSLATLDADVMVDGGWLLPLGQQQALEPWIAVYRRLPAVPFETLPLATQPVTIRTAVAEGRRWVYLVNDSPWHIDLNMQWSLPPGCQVHTLGDTRQIEPPTSGGRRVEWPARLGPYDLVAVVVSDPQAALEAASVSVPPEALAELERRIRDLEARAVSLGQQPPLDVIRNADFEEPPTTGEPLPGWVVSQREGISAQLESGAAGTSTQAMRFRSQGTVGSLASVTFQPPTTGRLRVLVSLRTADPERQPPLRLAIEGQHDGREYYRYAPVGAESEIPIGNQWETYAFRVDDLPLEGLSDVRVRFDLMGAGEVWIDDVALYHLRFEPTERVELSQIIALASHKLRTEQHGDCLRLLEGYWPQFLVGQVPLTEQPVVRQRDEQRPGSERDATTAAPDAAPQGILGRMNRLLPRALQFY